MSYQTTSSLVTIGSMTFGNFDPTTMTGWTFYNLQGWFDGPGVRASYVPRTFASGSFDTQVYRDVRTITLSGTYVGTSYADAVAQAAALAGLLGDGSEAPFTVDGISANVRIAAEPVLAWMGDNSAFNFTVSFAATDPLKYGSTITATAISMPTSGGGIPFPVVNGVFRWGTVPLPQVASLTNSGTAQTSVQMTVAAGGNALTGGFQIVETVTGSVLQYSDDLPAGSSLVFDSSVGSVILNAQADRRGSLTIAQWWQVPALATRNVVFNGLSGTSTTATLTASLRSAYY